MQSGPSSRTELELYEVYARSNRVVRWILVSAALALVVEVFVGILYYGYTARLAWVGVSRKTFWDYLRLLIVPTAITIGVTLLNWMQSERARKAEDAQQELERESAEASRKRELDVAERRTQADSLQAYLNQIGQLLLDRRRPLRESATDSDVSILARARTLTVLTRLDASRKRSVLQFLYEARLIKRGHVVVDLRQADLSEADLIAIKLHRAYMCEADLRKATLSAADLSEADLSDADLSEADLSAANLRRADLRDADLRRADLRDADVREGDLSGADLEGANPLGAYLSAVNLRRANLSGADLREANLRDADLRDADLRGADLRDADVREGDLREANLSEADLSGVNLNGANLSGANLANMEGVSADTLRAQARSLKSATMPNGQKYEE